MARLDCVEVSKSAWKSGFFETSRCVLNPLAPGSSPGWPPRNSTSLPIRRTLAARCLRCLLTHMSALRELLATETASHDASTLGLDVGRYQMSGMSRYRTRVMYSA